MTPRKTLWIVLALAGSMACYHATIETGLAPGPQTLEKGFASAWVYGLVPPATVQTAARCPDGVARVETQQSFVNGLVGLLTLGIYTPMNIRVTCAAARPGGSAANTLSLDRAASVRSQREALTRELRSVGVGAPIVLVFD